MMFAEICRVVDKPKPGQPGIRFEKKAAMTWRDYVIALLHIATGVEHKLMVQYLYAAYSLGGPGLSPDQAAQVAGWQKSIIAVAKEEMGHLLTVQNILALLGAPPDFTRPDAPSGKDLSAIPFVLDPLTRETAASFVFAEMAPDLEALLEAAGPHLRKSLREFLDHHELREIRRETKRHTASLGFHGLRPHPVALLYDEIIRVIGNSDFLADSEFDEMSYEVQASWDDWGRGYANSPKLLSASGDVISPQPDSHRAQIFIARAATRTEALKALHAIGGQGEAVHLKHRAKHARGGGDAGEISHFERFLEIWQHYPDNWRPYRNVLRNPVTGDSVEKNHNAIKDPEALDWARLFNIRYRMLLTLLSHSFRLSRVVRRDEPNLRGVVMHRAFGEMYNLKTIAGILARIRISKPGEDEVYAGPPFEMPYSLNMPAARVDCFRLHRDIYLGAIELTRRMQSKGLAPGQDYLQSLRELDEAALGWVEGILRVSETTERA